MTVLYYRCIFLIQKAICQNWARILLLVVLNTHHWFQCRLFNTSWTIFSYLPEQLGCREPEAWLPGLTRWGSFSVRPSLQCIAVCGRFTVQRGEGELHTAILPTACLLPSASQQQAVEEEREGCFVFLRNIRKCVCDSTV